MAGDERGHVTVRHDDVLGHEPAGADVLGGKVRHVDASDQRHEVLQPVVGRLHVVDQLLRLDALDGHLGRVQAVAHDEEDRPLLVDDRLQDHVRVANGDRALLGFSEVLERRFGHLRHRGGGLEPRLDFRFQLRVPAEQPADELFVVLTAMFFVHGGRTSP